MPEVFIPPWGGRPGLWSWIRDCFIASPLPVWTLSIHPIKPCIYFTHMECAIVFHEKMNNNAQVLTDVQKLPQPWHIKVITRIYLFLLYSWEGFGIHTHPGTRQGLCESPKFTCRIYYWDTNSHLREGDPDCWLAEPWAVCPPHLPIFSVPNFHPEWRPDCLRVFNSQPLLG